MTKMMPKMPKMPKMTNNNLILVVVSVALMVAVFYIFTLQKVIAHHQNPGHNHPAFPEYKHVGDAFCLAEVPVDCNAVMGIYGKPDRGNNNGKYFYFASKPGSTTQKLAFQFKDSDVNCTPDSACQKVNDKQELKISGNDYIFRENLFER